MKKLSFFILTSLAYLSIAFANEPVKQNDPLSAIVKITTMACAPDFIQPWAMSRQGGGSGSGVIINGNLILTNAHNVSYATYITVERERNGKPTPAKIKAINHQADLALLEVEDKSFFEKITPFEIGETPPAQTQVFVVGYPVGGDGISITQGVISRIERIEFLQYPYESHLAAQLDAAINPGNSGGPIILNGKIVGIAFQSGQGDGIGYMIHTDIIKHFLNEVATGEVRGFGEIGFLYQTLESTDMRNFLKMTNNQSGIVITKVLKHAKATPALKLYDVILSIDGFKILNNGNIKNERGEVVNFGTILDRKRLGDNVELEIWRDGKTFTATCELTKCNYKVKPPIYSGNPKYLLLGGYVFTTLSLSYLNEFKSTPTTFIHLFPEEYESPDCETIIVSQVLGDESTEGFKGISNEVLVSVNGKTFKNLKELAEYMDSLKEGYAIFVMKSGAHIIANVESIKKATPRVMKNYKIPSDRVL